MHNFYAGPSKLPEEVKDRARAMLNGDMTLLEISHRSLQFGEVMEKVTALAKRMLQLPDHEIIFLQGGGRQQFFQIPYNLSQVFQTAYYVDTGSWAHQAQQEAKFFGKTKTLASSQTDGYRYIPEIPSIPDDASYVYITSNNTIYGTQYHQLPRVSSALVVDMSSDLFAKSYDFSRVDLLYAATQKNIGTAGACMVALRKELLKKPIGSLPAMIDYRTHINKHSLYNTPPVFAILMALYTMEWIEEQGGINYFEQKNLEKSNLLYQEIARNSCFTAYADSQHRSIVNVVFSAVNKTFEHEFSDFVSKYNIVGIKGHKNLGGFRASTYNALSIDSVKVLVQAMQEFEQTR